MVNSDTLDERPSITDVSYMAGLVDGEGCIGIRKQKRRKGNHNYVAHTCIGSSDRPVLEWCKAIWGGSISPQKTSTNRPFWLWALGPAAAGQLLRDIRRYLKIKQDQAWLILEFRTQSLDLARDRKIGEPLSDEELSLREGYYQSSLWLNSLRRGQVAASG